MFAVKAACRGHPKFDNFVDNPEEVLGLSNIFVSWQLSMKKQQQRKLQLRWSGFVRVSAVSCSGFLHSSERNSRIF